MIKKLYVNIIKSYCDESEENHHTFLEFSKNYHTFKPYFDFVVCI